MTGTIQTERTHDRIVFRFMAAPVDVNVEGNSVPVGRVLEWIDKAGYACAVGWSRNTCVTAYVGNVHFTPPIRPGALVEVHARIILTGRSSMHILVTVHAGDVRGLQLSEAMHCVLVFVAVDDTGRPVAVETWKPGSVADLELQQLASVFRFLASPADRNWAGNAHGGTVMRWIDEAAFACAAGWSSPKAVAVYAGGIQFHSPIHIGDVVEVSARLIHTTARSMHISVLVKTGPPGTSATITARCMTEFVDVSQEGRAAGIRQLRLTSEEGVRLSQHALQLSELRNFMEGSTAYLNPTPPRTEAHPRSSCAGAFIERAPLMRDGMCRPGGSAASS